MRWMSWRAQHVVVAEGFDTDILPETPLFAQSLFFHPYFTMLEDKVRIQDWKDRNEGWKKDRLIL